MWVVYLTHEPATGRYYVGKSHSTRLAAGYQGSGTWVLRALAKGRQLHVEILSAWASEEDAYEAEFVVVSSCRCDALCMNMAAGGRGGTLGLKPSAETVAKRQASLKQAYADPARRAKMVAIGREVASREGLRAELAARAKAAWAARSPEQRTAQANRAWATRGEEGRAELGRQMTEIHNARRALRG